MPISEEEWSEGNTSRDDHSFTDSEDRVPVDIFLAKNYPMAYSLKELVKKTKPISSQSLSGSLTRRKEVLMTEIKRSLEVLRREGKVEKSSQGTNYYRFQPEDG